MTTDPLTSVAQQRVGQVLRGKWRLDGLLGVGGMAAVFAATHRNGNRVAIKILHPQIAVDPSIQQRFLREGYVANSVGHDGAVSVLDDDVTDDGAVFLVMELLEGETLDARATRLGGRLPLNEVVSFADQLLDVLVAAHANGIIHRDIKPENLFITTKGVLKVLDFGIARLLERAGSTAATKTGSMLGTPAFMPPEQALGYVKQVDQQSDVWAVGAMMFTLLSGDVVHTGTTVNEQLVSAATKPARSLGVVASTSPPGLVEVVDRALAFDKAQRWPTAASMLQALQAASGQAPQLASSGTVAAAPTRDQLHSGSTEIALSGSGTAAMVGPPPTTASGMAVGRTVADEPAPRRSPSTAALVGIGAAGVLLLVGAVGAIGLFLSDDQDEAASPIVVSATPDPSKPAELAPVQSAPASTEGTVNLDALPVASSRVDILSEGGSCDVFVDDQPKGNTPVNSLEVSPGEHAIRCEASQGRTQQESVDARAGEKHEVVFKLPPIRKVPAAHTAAPAKTVNPLDMR